MTVNSKNLAFATTVADAQAMRVANSSVTVLVTDNSTNLRAFTETAENAVRIGSTSPDGEFKNALSVYSTSDEGIYLVFSGFGRATWLLHRIGQQLDIITEQILECPVLDKIKPAKTGFEFSVELAIFVTPPNGVAAIKNSLLANSTQELSIESSENALRLFKLSCVEEAKSLLLGKTEPLDLVTRLYGVTKKEQKLFLSNGADMSVTDTFAISQTGLYGGLVTTRNAALDAAKKAAAAANQVVHYPALIAAVSAACSEGLDSVGDELLVATYSPELIAAVFAAHRSGKTTNVSSLSTSSEEMADSIVRVAFIATEIVALSYYTKLRQSGHTAVGIVTELDKFVSPTVVGQYELYSKLYVCGTKTAGKITAKDLEKVLPTSAEAIALSKKAAEAAKFASIKFDTNSTYFQKLTDSFCKVNIGTDAAPQVKSYLTKKEVQAMCEAHKRPYDLYLAEFAGKTTTVETVENRVTTIDYIIPAEVLKLYAYTVVIDGVELKAEFDHITAERYDMVAIWNTCAAAFARAKEVEHIEDEIAAGNTVDIDTLISFTSDEDKELVAAIIAKAKERAAAASLKKAEQSEKSKFNARYFERTSEKLRIAAASAPVDADSIVAFMVLMVSKAVTADGIDTKVLTDLLNTSKDEKAFATFVANSLSALYTAVDADEAVIL